MRDLNFILWQIKIWDRFAKFSPLLLIALIATFYLLGYRDWDLILYICIGLFFSVSVIWWFWVIYTIALLVYTINNSGKKIVNIIEELKEINQAVNDRKNRHNR